MELVLQMQEVVEGPMGVAAVFCSGRGQLAESWAIASSMVGMAGGPLFCQSVAVWQFVQAVT